MKLVLADFVIQNEACIRFQGSACMQYPARPIDYQFDDWPYRCSWVMLPKAFDMEIESRIQVMTSSRVLTTVVAVLAVQSDGSADYWSNTPKWPDAVAIIESVQAICLREKILSSCSEPRESLLHMMKTLIHSVFSFHRHGIAHGNLHSLTIRVHQGEILLPPILIGHSCFDVQYDYCPPEHLLSSSHSPSLAADIWSLACVMLEVLSGQSSFCGVDPGQILHRQQSQLSIPSKERYLNLINWRDDGIGCRHHFSMIIASMLCHKAEERPSLLTVLDGFEKLFKERSDFGVQVQPDINDITIAGPGNPIVIGRTKAWWRQPCNRQDRLSTDRRLTPETMSGETGRDNMETVQIDIDFWYNNRLNFDISRVVLSLQLGDQIFVSEPILYPTRSLNISHRFAVNHDDMITICNLRPLLIRLQSDDRMDESSYGELLAIAEVDLRPLLSGFPVIEGCYQLEPADAGQITVKVQPMCSVDQRDVDSTVHNPTWNLFQSFILSD